MSKHSKQPQTILEATLTETDDEQFQRLLKEAGLVPRLEKEIFSPQQKVEKIVELLDLLKIAKESKDERLAKKIRRTLRKKFGFSIREHMRVVI